MARPRASTRDYKISMSEEISPVIEALATLGLYGKTPSEVIRKMAESHLEKLLYHEQVLTKAGFDLPSLLSEGKRRSANKKS